MHASHLDAEPSKRLLAVEAMEEDLPRVHHRLTPWASQGMQERSRRYGLHDKQERQGIRVELGDTVGGGCRPPGRARNRRRGGRSRRARRCRRDWTASPGAAPPSRRTCRSPCSSSPFPSVYRSARDWGAPATGDRRVLQTL